MATLQQPIKFGTNDLDAALANQDLDKLAFGAVQLDPTGKILKYNAMEGQITGRDPKAVLGKNFFKEVAPCTNSPTFFGRFQEGVKKNDLNVMFEYVFNYKMTPTSVKIHMKKSLTDNTVWIFIKRM
ncbi:MAG: photoactive yellow protein [Phycisphaerales bacterium]|jgi:photoactive yellow protein